jgi:hypothetical protein
VHKVGVLDFRGGLVLGQRVSGKGSPDKVQHKRARYHQKADFDYACAGEFGSL